jgi:hypothetical protein
MLLLFSVSFIFLIVLSSIRYDDGSLRLMQHLLRCGILDVIAPEQEIDDHSTSTATTSIGEKPPKSPEGRKTRASILNPRASFVVVDNYQIPRLHDIFFLDLTIAAWTIKLHNTKVLAHLVKKGYDVTLSVDNIGNSCLHYIAAYGTPDMIDVVIADKRIRYEQQNPDGFTAGMLAAKNGNIKVAKRLFELRVDARKSLEGKYAAWVLAFVRKYEKNQRNLQTGRYGDDDENYFNTSPDPFYCTWYNG